MGTAHTYLYDGRIAERDRRGNSYALHLFVNGIGRMTVADRQFQVEKGSLVFIPPGVPHSFQVSPGQPLFTYNIYFDLWETDGFKSAAPQFAYDMKPLAPEWLTAVRLCDELERLPLVSSLLLHPDLIDHFIHTVKLFAESGYARAKTINSFFCAWLLQWFEAEQAPRRIDARIASVIAELENGPERQYSTERLCRKCGLEKSYFYKLFKQATGMKPIEYQTQLRMKKASAILQESPLPVTSVAEALGYQSIHYFTRQFTAHYGISPTQFRNGHRKP